VAPQPDFAERLAERASNASITLTESELAQLDTFRALLTKWNAKINLTSLILDPLGDQALDRLFLEPLAAARYFPAGRVAWFDVGSGGGSPALPLKVVRSDAALRMVESRERKVAFLREAVRAMELSSTVVDSRRFEELAAEQSAVADVMTVRAVRMDASLSSAIATLLKPGGQLMLFASASPDNLLRSFSLRQVVSLPGGGRLSIIDHVPRGT
jgi:16S rRNA (guanine527-N7)-methyltransferase